MALEKVKVLLLAGLLAVLPLAASWGQEGQAPLSRVLLTETDVRASIAKVSLTRYYLERASRADGEPEGARREAAGRAARSLGAAMFYVRSSLALTRGELKSDLAALLERLEDAEGLIEREPVQALAALAGVEESLRQVLSSIDRASRTYKGSDGWVPFSIPADGVQERPGGLPSQ